MLLCAGINYKYREFLQEHYKKWLLARKDSELEDLKREQLIQLVKLLKRRKK
jgi:hypothetical protein